MSTPSITLTATLEDILGSADPQAYLRITLCGLYGFVPRIAGTAIVAKIQQLVYQNIDTGIWSAALWGNDALTPTGSFYCIEVIDGNGNIAQSGNYLIVGSGSQDLSGMTQYFPPPPIEPPFLPVLQNPQGGDGTTQVIDSNITIDGNLIVTGTINGGNSLFVVAYTPTMTLDGTKGGNFKTTITGPVNITITNMVNKGIVSVHIIQDGTGGHLVTWDGSKIRNAPAVSPGPNARTIQLFAVDADGTFDAAAPAMFS